MSQRYFFDTNIVVYAHDTRDRAKHQVAQSLLRSHILDHSAVISTQVVQEFCHVALIKRTTSLHPEDLQEVLDSILFPIMKLQPSADFYRRAVRLFTAYALSFYDALIVQAALDLGCTKLYSEDLQAGQTFGKLRIVNPFRQ